MRDPCRQAWEDDDMTMPSADPPPLLLELLDKRLRSVLRAARQSNGGND
jgi:hypothetical protein